ncbi:uncharacterized protein [Watersipora subatra]|uniref:uncharacterized protein n=1 Tax=Watersipora subatra TaxID=2589382 RepID=UPI00355C70A1
MARSQLHYRLSMKSLIIFVVFSLLFLSIGAHDDDKNRHHGSSSFIGRVGAWIHDKMSQCDKSPFYHHHNDFLSFFKTMYDYRSSDQAGLAALQAILSDQYSQAKEALEAQRANLTGVEHLRCYLVVKEQLKRDYYYSDKKIDTAKKQLNEENVQKSSLGGHIARFREFIGNILATRKFDDKSSQKAVSHEIKNKYEDVKKAMERVKHLNITGQPEDELREHAEQMLKDYRDDVEKLVEKWKGSHGKGHDDDDDDYY